VVFVGSEHRVVGLPGKDPHVDEAKKQTIGPLLVWSPYSIVGTVKQAYQTESHDVVHGDCAGEDRPKDKIAQNNQGGDQGQKNT
jgi:hypothetical protein